MDDVTILDVLGGRVPLPQGHPFRDPHVAEVAAQRTPCFGHQAHVAPCLDCPLREYCREKTHTRYAVQAWLLNRYVSDSNTTVTEAVETIDAVIESVESASLGRRMMTPTAQRCYTCGGDLDENVPARWMPDRGWRHEGCAP